MTCLNRLMLTCLVSLSAMAVHAQESETFRQSNERRKERFERFRRQKSEDFNDFREQKRREFEEFRRKRNEEFAKYLRKDWTPFSPKPEIPQPKDDTVPPVVVPKEEELPPPPAPKPVKIEEVIPAPEPVPQPMPIDPIEEVPVTPVAPETPTHSFTFLGTPAEVRLDVKHVVSIPRLSNNAIADAWLELSEQSYTNLIHDCLELRSTHKLCDWAYLTMLHQMAESICGKGTNESILLMAYVYCQSGYQMRLAMDDTQLYMLFASHHKIYNWNYFVIDEENYYPYPATFGDVVICPQQYPKEQRMSLLVEHEPILEMDATEASTHQSMNNKEMVTTTKANQNLLDFYTSYPSSMVGDNPVSRWAMYANMPMPEAVRQQLYPQLKKAVEGMSPREAAECILSWLQYGFKYEFDYTVWGGDRAFFPEETLHYPYCDCEDRAILYTRIIRDLMGLDCILVFYPGHLASAVSLPEPVIGDYIEVGGKRFTITDPTYIGASVGMTMPDMDNAKAKVILLK